MPLWVLGDRFRSPLFINEVIYSLFDKFYVQEYLTTQEIEFVYSHTSETSKLSSRKFAKQLNMIHAPLSENALKKNNPPYEADWHFLIRQGGNLVLDLVKHGCLLTKDEGTHLSAPYWGRIKDLTLNRSLLDPSRTF